MDGVRDRMPALSFPGSYEDDHGVDELRWHIEQANGSYEIHTVVRGIPVRGIDFDGLEPAAPGLPMSSFGDLGHCLLGGDLPCEIEVDGHRRPGVVRFALDLRSTRPERNLALSTVVDGATHTVADAWFEDGLLLLERTFPANVQLVSCVTCLYSDYSPPDMV